MDQCQLTFPALSFVSNMSLNSNDCSLSKVNLFWEVNQDFEKFYQYLDPFPSTQDLDRLSAYSTQLSQSTYVSGDLGSLADVGIYSNLFERNSGRDIKMSSSAGNILMGCDWLSHMTKHPVSKKYFNAKLVLRNKGLQDLSALGNHRFIQCLDLGHNCLRDVSGLGSLRFLMNLDLSYNQLTETLSFAAPWYLTHVDLSHNCIKTINDFSEYWSLVYLDLSYNRIEKIDGLQSLKHLRHLDLSNNEITRIEHLSAMNLLILNLSYNKISSFEQDDNKGLRSLKRLKELNLEHNEISSLGFLANMIDLQILVIGNNNIVDIVELTYLRGMLTVIEASFINNAVSNHRFYRNVIFDTLRAIQMLDGKIITAKEKVSCWPGYGRCPRMRANKIYRLLKNLEMINGGPRIGPHVMPCDESPIPLVVLVGPPGCGKSSVAFRIQYEFRHYIYWANVHTTAEKSLQELYVNKQVYQNNNRLIHITTDSFSKKLKNGDFYAVTDICGASYGFCSSELATAITSKKLCLVVGDLCFALQLKLRRLFPFIVLAMPKSSHEYVKFLSRKYRHKVYMYDVNILKTIRPELESILDDLHVNENLDVRINKEATLLDLLFSTRTNSSYFLSTQASSINQNTTYKLNELNEKMNINSNLESSSNDKKSEKHINIADAAVQYDYHPSFSVSSGYSEPLRSKSLSISQTAIRPSPELSGNSCSMDGDNLPSFTQVLADPMIDFINYCKLDRDEYLRHFVEFADIFTKVVWTDDISLAIASLKPILRKAYRSGSSHLQHLDAFCEVDTETHDDIKM